MYSFYQREKKKNKIFQIKMMYFKDLGNSEKSKPKLKERSNKNQSRNKDKMIKKFKNS